MGVTSASLSGDCKGVNGIFLSIDFQLTRLSTSIELNR